MVRFATGTQTRLGGCSGGATRGWCRLSYRVHRALVQCSAGQQTGSSPRKQAGAGPGRSKGRGESYCACSIERERVRRNEQVKLRPGQAGRQVGREKVKERGGNSGIPSCWQVAGAAREVVCTAAGESRARCGIGVAAATRGRA